MSDFRMSKRNFLLIFQLLSMIVQFVSSESTKQDSSSQNEKNLKLEQDFIYSSNNLNRLRKLFDKNGMFILNRPELEENYALPRFKEEQPEDEALLNVENEESFNSNVTIIQGDIIVDNTNSFDKPKRAGRKKRRIINNNQFGHPTRWPNSLIPYEFDTDATETLKKKFFTAVNLWHQHTCIRFEPYSPVKHAKHKSKVLIRNRGHCAARVGYVIDPYQRVGISDVYLPEHCPLGSVIHELGHVIGFRHEHTRYDRTNHIKVHYEKMQSTQRAQYDIMENGFPGYFGIYYDLFSIMHYSSQGGLIEAYDPRRSFLMGQRFTLSFSDVKMANEAYGCGDNCPKSLTCENEGFVDMTCKCRCPDDIVGERCETVLKKEVYLKNSTNPNLSCDFENDLCEWNQEETRDSEDWVRNIGLTKTQLSFQKDGLQLKTGPQLVEKDRINSTYIYFNSFDQTKAYANAILTSPQILVNSTQKKCIKFSFHMYSYPLFKLEAPVIGKLAVKLRYSNGEIKRIWERFGSHGDEWQQGEVELELEPPHTVVFLEAEAFDWKYGDIALDDIIYLNHGCKESVKEQMTTTAQNHSIAESRQRSNQFEDWSDWSECSKSCGGGVKTRVRSCLGANCVGHSKEYLDCNKEPCPTTKKPEEWGAWTDCSSTCGNGYQYRFRICIPGDNCLSTKEVKACNLGDCTTLSTTTSTTTTTTTKTTKKTTTTRKPPEEEAFASNEMFTPPFHTEHLISSYWSDWSEWSACNQTCWDRGIAELSQRTRECIYPHKVGLPDSLFSNMAIRNDCTGPNREIRQCVPMPKCKDPTTTARTSTVRSIASNEWSEWSDCSVRCGLGSRTRIRRCDKERDGALIASCITGNELIMERTICNVSCPSEDRPLLLVKITPPTPPSNTRFGLQTSLTTITQMTTLTSVWSEWSEWTKCEAECGRTDIVKRRRRCLGFGCTGRDIETKTCVNSDCPDVSISEKLMVETLQQQKNLTNICKNGCSRSSWQVLLNSLAENATWSEWSEWSECFIKQPCSPGIRIKKRNCMVSNQIVASSKCSGVSYYTADCVDESCAHSHNETVPSTRKGSASAAVSVSEWSECSNTCGIGLITRQVGCMMHDNNEVECVDRAYQQKSCESYTKCSNQTIFMHCSFDQVEYCPLEQSEKGNSHWKLSSPTLPNYSRFKITPSPLSGSNYVSLGGAFLKSSIQTPIISISKAVSGQCLSFYYFQNSYSKIEINKINMDGSTQRVFEKEYALIGNNWRKVQISIQSSTDYFIEFNGVTGMNAESIIALDDIQLNTIDKCQVLTCQFENDNCRPNQVLGNDISSRLWIIESFADSKSQNKYLRADVSQIRFSQNTFYGFPVVTPSYSSMCASFRYLLNGSNSVELRLGLIQLASNELTYIWKESTNQNKVWKKTMIDFSVERNFQLVLELWNKTAQLDEGSNDIVAIDSVRITYGPCSLMKNTDLEENVPKVSNNDYHHFMRYPNAKHYVKKRSLPQAETEIDSCGGVFELKNGDEMILKSPGYPENYKLNQYCAYLIKSPNATKIQIAFIDLNIEDNERHDTCNDYLEIRYFNVGQPGPKFCGDLEKYRGEFSITSYENVALLIFSSDWAVIKTGFMLNITTTTTATTE